MSEPNPKEQIEMVANILGDLALTPPPTLGLDMDGVLDESPIFFGLLTAVWPGKVIVITYRDDRAKAEADLTKLGIKYDELVLVRSFDEKGQVIVEKGVGVYVDDQPEALKNVPPNVTVLLMRNGGNFDEKDRLWTFSRRTCKLM